MVRCDVGVRPDGAHCKHHGGPAEPDGPPAAAQLPHGAPRGGVERRGVLQQRPRGIRAVHSAGEGCGREVRRGGGPRCHLIGPFFVAPASWRVCFALRFFFFSRFFTLCLPGL